jgi:hypothetical protein
LVAKVFYQRITRSQDGGIVLTGSLWLGNASAISLSKVDGDGNLVWDTYFAGGHFPGGRAITEISDGGLLIAGDTWGAGGVVVQTDSDGGERWVKQFGSGENVYQIAYILEDEDGGFVMAGEAATLRRAGWHEFPGRPDVYLLKLDASGEEVWSMRTGEPEGEGEGE